ncbi:hypothetical protein ACQSSU_14650 [Micromonospora echinospora]
MNGGTVHNVAKGNARVGFQARDVHGPVRIGDGTSARPTDLGAELAALRSQLKEAHRAGQVDEATYTAAEAEMEIVTRTVDAAPGGGEAVVALRRLRGLVDDVPALSARLADIIVLVRGRS